MSLPPVHKTKQDQLAEFVFPHALVWLVYFLVSSLLLVILNIQPLLQYFSRTVLGNEVIRTGDYSLLTEPIVEFINKFDTPVLMIFWAAFGCVVFGLTVFLRLTFSTVRQEVEESHYLTGGLKPNRKYWRSVIRLNLFFVLFGVIWLVYLGIYFNGILPWVSHLFFEGLEGSWQQSYRILIALAANTLAFYVFMKITQLVIYIWRQIKPKDPV